MACDPGGVTLPAWLCADVRGAAEDLAVPHGCPDRCLQLVARARVTQMLWGAAGVSGGSLGRRAEQVPSLPFVVCPQGDRVETYRELESVLQGGDGCLTSGVVNRLIAEASGDVRADQVSLFSVKATKAACLCPWFGGVAQKCAWVIQSQRRS